MNESDLDERSRWWLARIRAHPNLEEWKQEEEAKILTAIHSRLDEFEKLLDRCSGKWGYEDPVYRFYHESMKVFYVQERTEEIVTALQSLAPHLPLNSYFQEIIKRGTGKEFTHQSNNHWLAEAAPIIEAFLHARYFLEMICKYGRIIKEPPDTIPSGWAAVLYLWNLR